MPRLQGKIAIVTGAARGMGEIEARLFAEEGATVVLCDVSDDQGQRVADDIVAHGGTAEYCHLNVTDEDNWRDVIGATVSQHGRLDILVNNGESPATTKKTTWGQPRGIGCSISMPRAFSSA